MRKKNKEKLLKFIFFVVVAVLGVTTSYFMDFSAKNNYMETYNLEDSSEGVKSLSTYVEPKLQVQYIDVGQADAILVTQGESVMLIDAGKNDSEEYLVNYLKQSNITKFEYVIGTHAHEDDSMLYA